MTDAMKRGGKRRKPKTRSAQKQIVNVKVNVGDTVLLQKGNAPQQQAQSSFGQFRLMEGVGAKYANQPVVQQQESYGIYPASKAPIHNDIVRVGGGAPYNAKKVDDVRIDTNPNGLAPIMKPSTRLASPKDASAAFRVNYPIQSTLPLVSDDPTRHLAPDQTPSRRAMPSQPSAGYSAMRFPTTPASIRDQVDQEEQYMVEPQRAMSVAEASESPSPSDRQVAPSPAQTGALKNTGVQWQGVDIYVNPAGVLKYKSNKAGESKEGYISQYISGNRSRQSVLSQLYSDLTAKNIHFKRAITSGP